MGACVTTTQGKKTKHTSQKEQTHLQTVLSFTVPVGEKLGKGGTECVPVLDKHTCTHKCSIILEMAPTHTEETKCDSTVFSLPDPARAHTSVCDCVSVCPGWAWTPLWQPVTMAGL